MNVIIELCRKLTIKDLVITLYVPNWKRDMICLVQFEVA